MEAKKAIRRQIGVNWDSTLLAIIVTSVGVLVAAGKSESIQELGVIIATVGAIWLFLAGTFALINWFSQHACLKRLEKTGKLELAAEELAGDQRQLVQVQKGTVVFTPHFLFAPKGSGVVCAYEDIVWAYKQVNKVTIFYIPIKKVEFMVLCVGRKQFSVRLKSDDAAQVIMELYRRNTGILVGHNAENQKKYKEFRKQHK